MSGGRGTRRSQTSGFRSDTRNGTCTAREAGGVAPGLCASPPGSTLDPAGHRGQRSASSQAGLPRAAPGRGSQRSRALVDPAGQSYFILSPRRWLSDTLTGVFISPARGAFFSSRLEATAGVLFLAFCLLSGVATLYPRGGKHKGLKWPTEMLPGHTGAPGWTAILHAGLSRPRGRRAGAPAGRGEPWLRRRDAEY